jgi:hypothetical protein
MTEILVEPLGENAFQVTVSEDASQTSHRVTADPAYLETLASGRSTRAVVSASFRFLLDREPKEAILRSFDLRVIERFFPEFGPRLSGYLHEE